MFISNYVKIKTLLGVPLVRFVVNSTHSHAITSTYTQFGN